MDTDPSMILLYYQEIGRQFERIDASKELYKITTKSFKILQEWQF